MFSNDTGYIECDRAGLSPKICLDQCNFFAASKQRFAFRCDIPLGILRITGVIGAILWRGRQYRIATYLGAKAETVDGGRLVVRQGKLKLTARLIKKQESLLYAPVGGVMTRKIRESLSCTAYYLLEEDGKTLFEIISDRASFEYEYGSHVES
jgi:hypothetical protein